MNLKKAKSLIDVMLQTHYLPYSKQASYRGAGIPSRETESHLPTMIQNSSGSKSLDGREVYF